MNRKYRSDLEPDLMNGAGDVNANYGDLGLSGMDFGGWGMSGLRNALASAEAPSLQP